VWLQVAEILPLRHPVRLARYAFYGAHDGYPSASLALWDLVYCLLLSLGLLAYARRWVRFRLTDSAMAKDGGTPSVA